MKNPAGCQKWKKVYGVSRVNQGGDFYEQILRVPIVDFAGGPPGFRLRAESIWKPSDGEKNGCRDG
jgi:hypothetical protein